MPLDVEHERSAAVLWRAKSWTRTRETRWKACRFSSRILGRPRFRTRSAASPSWGRATEARIRLTVRPIDLDPIVVMAVRRRIELPGLEDFERRYYSGWGQFVLEEDIERRNPTRLTDALAETGLEIAAGGTSVIVRRTGCAPMVYIDGVKVTRLSRGGGPVRRPSGESGVYLWRDPETSTDAEAAAAINLMNPGNVLAVEVYKGPAETPGQYIDSNSRCGVVLIWTRRGGELGGG